MTLTEFIIRIRLAGGQAARELQDILRRSNAAKGGLNQTGQAAAGAGNRLRGMAGQARTLNAELAKLARRSRIRFGIGGNIGGGFVGGMTGSLGATAGAAITARGTSGAVDFEDAVNAAAVTAKMSAAQQAKYSAELLKVSERTGMLPSQLATLGTEMARAGVKTENLAAAAEGWAMASRVAGKGMERLTGNADAIGRMTGLMQNNFGLRGAGLSKGIAQLSMVANDTTLDLDNMVQAMSKIGPEVAAVGGSFQEALMYASISARGGKTAALTGGQFASFAKDIRDPKKQDKLKALGIQFDGKEQNEVIGQILEKYYRASKEDKIKLINAIGRYGQGFLTAAEGLTPEARQQYLNDLQKGGMLSEDFIKRQQTMKANIASLWAAIERFFVALSDAGVFETLIDIIQTHLIPAVNDFAKWLKENKGQIKEWIPTILKAAIGLWALAKVFAIIGSVLSFKAAGGFATLGRAFGFLIGGARLLLVALGWIVAGIAAVAGVPVWVVGAIIAAIAALATAIWYYWDEIKAAFSHGVAAIASFHSAMWAAGAAIMDGLWNGLKARGAAIWSWMSEFAGSLISRFKTFFGIASPSKVFHGFGENLMQGLNRGMEGMRPAVNMALSRTTSGLLNPSLVARPQLATGQGTVINVSVQGNGDHYLQRVGRRVAQEVATGTVQRQGGRVNRAR